MEAPTNQQLIDFVIHEARLIDQHRLDEWLDLFTDDGIYWMPLEWGQTDPKLMTSLMYEDKLLLTIRIVRWLYHGRLRKGAAWDCGFPMQTPRMQDTAEGFGQPIRQVFEAFFRIDRTLPSPFDREPRYRMIAEDHFWYWLYLPLARSADVVARLVGSIQQGRISVYLMYSFFTLLALLFFIR